MTSNGKIQVVDVDGRIQVTVLGDNGGWCQGDISFAEAECLCDQIQLIIERAIERHNHGQ